MGGEKHSHTFMLEEPEGHYELWITLPPRPSTEVGASTQLDHGSEGPPAGLAGAPEFR